MQYPIYLDYNATTPLDPTVLEKMLPYFREHFGNASSTAHVYGWMAEEAVEQARQEIASVINARPNEIIFTSGATESCNLAIKGYAEANQHKGNHIITVSTEHKAVLDVCDYLNKKGFEITYLPVDNNGMIDLGLLENSIQSKTLMIAAMYSNNETGVIHPIKEIAGISEKHGICFFTDATQSFGKVKIDVHAENIDLMAFSSHKIYGPKGVGGLYIRNRQPSIKLATLIHGGGHENKLRSGTLNVPGIVGFGAAGLLSMDLQKNDLQNYLQLNEALSNGIKKMNGVNINAVGAVRMPNVLNICFDLEGGEGLLKKISKHVAVASGSACSSAIVEPSHVLTAMGLDRRKANSSVRFSFGRTTTLHEIQRTFDFIQEALNI